MGDLSPPIRRRPRDLIACVGPLGAVWESWNSGTPAGGLVLPPQLFSQRDAVRGTGTPDPALLLDTIETLPAASGGGL